jgi:hypothetical protein
MSLDTRLIASSAPSRIGRASSIAFRNSGEEKRALWDAFMVFTFRKTIW